MVSYADCEMKTGALTPSIWSWPPKGVLLDLKHPVHL